MTLLDKLVLPEIRELIKERNFHTLCEVICEWLPPDIAAVMLRLEPDEQAVLFQSLEIAHAADVFSYLPFHVQEELVDSLPIGEFAKILAGMAPDDRTRFLARLPKYRVGRLLSLLPADERQVAEVLLAYPSDSIGHLMTPDYIAVKDDWTIEHVLDFVRTYGKDRETLNAVYVVDERGKLIDDIRMRQILLAPPAT